MVGIVQDKRRLFIIGASSLGREVESWLELIPELKRDWYLEGYLDKDKNALNGYPSDYQIIGDEEYFDFKEEDFVILAISEPKIKEKIYYKLKQKINFFTYISPNSIIGKNNVIGEGSIICPNTILTTNIKIGMCTLINIGSQIGHDCIIGDFTTINANVDIAGKCLIGERSFFGSNSIVIPKKKIGDDTKIGAGSVVIRNVKENTTVFGNPATILKQSKK